MKSILTSINNFLVDMGRIRAASYFASVGDVDAVRKIMLAK